MRRPNARELVARVREAPEAPYLIAIVAALVVGVALLATSTLIPIGAVLVLGGTGGALVAIIRAAQS